MARFFRLLCGLGLSAGLLVFIFKDVDVAQMTNKLSGIEPRYLLGYLATLGLMHVCRIFRWATLTRHLAPLSLLAHTRITSIGMALIILLPLRLGEFARPILLAQEADIPISSGVGAVAVERTLDGLLVTILFFLSLHLVPEGISVPVSLQTAGYASLTVFSGAFIVILANLFAHQKLERLLFATLGKLSPKGTDTIIQLLQSFTQGLQSLPNLRATGSVLLWTVSFWAVQAAGFWYVLEGFGWGLPDIAAWLMMCTIVLAIMLPAGPGFLGTYQGGILLALSLFGVSTTDAMAFGLVVYPLSLLFSVALGGGFLLCSPGSRKALLQPFALQKNVG